MKIGIDCRILAVTKTGIGYYLYNNLIEIFKLDQVNDYVLFTNKKIDIDFNKYKNIEVILDDSKLPGIAWYLLKVGRLIKQYDIDVFWGTQHFLPLLKNKNTKYILTIHDLVYYKFPQTMTNKNRLSNKFFLQRSIRNADTIIAVSKTTKELIKEFCGIKQYEKAQIIYEGASKECEIYNYKKDILDKFSLENKKYLLYVGTIEPRKGIEVLVRAYEKIEKKNGLELVLAGKMGWKNNGIMKIIKQSKDEARIKYLGYLTDEEKYILMKNAKIFVFPSIYEGFGLPVIEAMKCGTISIVADNSSLKELIEREELKFETNNSKELSKKVEKLLEDDKLYEEMKRYCKQREKKFDWEKSAQKHLKVLVGEMNE